MRKSRVLSLVLAALLLVFCVSLSACNDDEHTCELVERVGAKYLKEAATCNSPAVYYKSCSICGELSTETFTRKAAAAHTPAEVVDAKYLVSAATCTEGAVYQKSCSVCGKAMNGTFTHSEGAGTHTAAEVVDAKYLVSAATCTAPAVYNKSCSVCGEALSETFTSGEATGVHTAAEVVDAKYLVSAATCTAPAVYKKSCSVCGEALSETFTNGSALGHTTVEVVDAKYLVSAATCTAPAVYNKSCSVCGEALSETFTSGEANGHTAAEVVDAKYFVSAPDCTNPAVYHKSCSVCGSVLPETFTSGSAKGHTPADVVDAEYLVSEATCTAAAVYHKSCADCGEALSETFTSGSALGHTAAEVVAEEFLATPAGCTTPAVYYKSCSVCGEALSETFEVAANGHVATEVVDEAYLATAATCTKAATYFKTCSECGAKLAETFSHGDLAAHTAVEVAFAEYRKSEATCTAKAVYYKSCSVCKVALEETFEYGNFAAHTEAEVADEAYLVSEATCTAKAVYHKSCSVCEAELEATFSYGELAEHTEAEVANGSYLATAATCTEAAVYHKSCSVCYATLEDTFSYGDPLGHTAVELADEEYLVSEATCTEAAVYHKSCSVCGEELEDTFSYGSALGHTAAEVADEAYLVSEATCTAKAVYHKSCSVCEAELTETFEYGELAAHTLIHVEAVPATEQAAGNIEYWVCSECDAYFADAAGEVAIADKASVIIAKLNHVCVFDQEIVSALYLKDAATCTEAAVYKMSCDCGKASDTETFSYGEPNGHTVVEVADELYLVDPATCTDPSIYYKSCSVCGIALPEEGTFEGTPNGHTEAEVAEDEYIFSAATCTTAAVYYKSCSVCGEKLSGVFVYGTAKGHTEAEVAEAQYLVSAATCTDAAVYYKSCADCHVRLEDTFEGEANGHTAVEVVDEKYLVSAATCIEAGVYYKSCSVCGEALEQTFNSALAPHNGKFVAEVAASCTVDGLAAHFECTVCGKYFLDETCTQSVAKATLIIPAAHNYAEVLAPIPADGLKNAATCKSGAVYFKYCAGCGDFSADTFTYGDPIDCHYVVQETVAPTCLTAGYTYEMCDAGCGETRTVPGAPALDHDYHTVTTPSTCAQAGSVVSTCQREGCTSVLSQALPLSGHDYNAVVTAPTCTTAGYTTFTCKFGCGHSYVGAPTEALGHEFGEPVVNDATCTEAGSIVSTCTRAGCTHTDTEVIEATGHTPVGATCEDDAYCSVCSAKLADKLGHSWGVIDDVAATCYAAGYIEYECSTCHNTKRDVPATHKQREHLPGEWEKTTISLAGEGIACLHQVVENTFCQYADCGAPMTREGEKEIRHTYGSVIVDEATCQTPGTKKNVCSVCGAEETDAEGELVLTPYEAPDAHKFVDGGCTVLGCDKAKTTVGGTETNVSGDTLKNEIEFNDASLSLDDATREQLGDKEVSLKAETLTDEETINDMKDDLTDEQLALLGDKPIYNFEMSDKDGSITKFDGMITVKIPYDLNGEDPDDIVVWYLAVKVDDNGDPIPDGQGGYLHELTPVEAEYIVVDGQGYAVFATNHFSYYTVTRMTPAERCEKFDSHNKLDTVIVTVFPATCEANGYTLYSCLRCGQKWTTDPVEALGHNFERIEFVEGDCTTDRYEKFECKTCRVAYEVKDQAPGHAWEIVSETAATCTTVGQTVKKCLTCGEENTVTEAMLPHAFKENIVEATCTTAGYTEKICGDCGHRVVSGYVAPFGHEDFERVTDPTCLAKGYTEHYCKRCDSVYKIDNYTDTVDHEFDREEADCENDKVCRHCNKLEEKAHGHSFDENGKCKKCDNDCEHNNLKELPDQKPTCSEYGYKRYLCQDCHNQLLGDKIPMTEHKNKEIGRREATCTSPACIIEKCQVCKTETETYVGEALEHTYVAGVCTYCGKKDSLFYNNLVASIFSIKGGSLCIKDFTFIYEERDSEGLFAKEGGITIVDVAELMLYLDDNGQLAGGAHIIIEIENGPRDGITTMDIKAVLKDGYAYIDIVSNYLAMNMSARYSIDALIEALCEEYFDIPSDSLVGVLEIAESELLPLVDLLVAAHDEDINNVLGSILDIFFTYTVENGEYTFVLDYDKLRALNENLYTLPVSEVLDLYFGEGSYDAVCDFVLEILGMKIADIPAFVAELGIDTDTLYASINTILESFGFEEMDLDGFFASEDADIIIGVLLFEDEEYLDMVMEVIDGLKEVTAYELIMPGDAEQLYSMVGEVIDYVAEYFAFSFKTDKDGNFLGADVAIAPIVIAQGGSTRQTISFALSFLADGVIDIDWMDIVEKVNGIDAYLPPLEDNENYRYDGWWNDSGEMEYNGTWYMYEGMTYRVYYNIYRYSDLVGLAMMGHCGDWKELSIAYPVERMELTYSLRMLYTEEKDEDGDGKIEEGERLFLLCSEDGNVTIPVSMDEESGDLYIIGADGERIVLFVTEGGQPPMDDPTYPPVTAYPPVTVAPTTKPPVIYDPVIPVTSFVVSYDYPTVVYPTVDGEKVEIGTGDISFEYVDKETADKEYGDKEDYIDKEEGYYPVRSDYPMSAELAFTLFADADIWSYNSFEEEHVYINIATGDMNGSSCHKYVVVEEKEPENCGIDGYKLYRCENCGDEYTNHYNHFMHKWVIDYEQSDIPTECETEGMIVRVCETCGETTHERTYKSHEWAWKYRLHEGATSCEQGLDEVRFCTTCGMEGEVWEYAMNGHATVSVRIVKGDTVYSQNVCPCGEVNDLNPMFELALDGAFVAEDVEPSYEICIIPEFDGLYEFYSYGSGYSWGYIYDANHNQIAYGGEGSGVGDGFGMLAELKAGEQYFLRTENCYRGTVTLKPHDPENDITIPLAEYGCTCGFDLVIYSAFGGYTIDEEAFWNHNGKGDCKLQLEYGENWEGKGCMQECYFWVRTYTEAGEVTVFESERYSAGPAQHNGYEQHVGKEEGTESIDGVEVRFYKEMYEFRCWNCGMTYEKRENYTYVRENGEDFAERICNYLVGAEGEETLSKETYIEFRHNENYGREDLSCYTAYYTDGELTYWEKDEYSYEGCAIIRIHTDSDGKYEEIREERHTYTSKEVIEESGTTEGVDENGNPITVMTEMYEEYCMSCLKVARRYSNATTYNAEGDRVRYVRAEYLPFALSADETGFRVTEEHITEYITFVINGERIERTALERYVYYNEDGSVASWNGTRYEYSTPCEYTMVRESSDGKPSPTIIGTRHNTVWAYRLADGAVTCEDGVLQGEVCRYCDYERWNEGIWGYGHYNSENTAECFDAAEYGSQCGGTIRVTSCPCGERKSVNVDVDCDLDNSNHNRIWGDDGNGRYDYEIYTYGCSVTDTAEGRNPCGFGYTYENWYEMSNDCRRVWHYRYVIGLALDEPLVIEWSYDENGYYHQSHGEANKVGTYRVENGLEVYTTEHDQVCTKCGYRSQHVVNTDYVDPTTAKRVEHRHESTNYRESDGSISYVYTYKSLYYWNGNSWDERTAFTSYAYYNSDGSYSSANATEYTYDWIYSQDGTEKQLVKISEKNSEYQSYEEYLNNNASYWGLYEYDYTCLCRPIERYTHSDGEKWEREMYYDHYSWDEWHWEIEPTCTQPGVEARSCRWCDETETVDHPAFGHSYYQDDVAGIHRCDRCELENFTGNDGSVELEDLTWKLGNGTHYVIGYYDRGWGEYSYQVSVVLNPKTEDEDARLLNDYIAVEDTGSLLYVSIEDVKNALATFSAALGMELSICENMVRIEFVNMSNYTANDYGITLDPHILSYSADEAEEGKGASSHTATCTECGKVVKNGELCDWVLIANDVIDGTEVRGYACRHCENTYTETSWWELTDAENCYYTYFVKYEWANGVSMTEKRGHDTRHDLVLTQNGFGDVDKMFRPTHSMKCTVCDYEEQNSECNYNYSHSYTYTEDGVEKHAQYQWCYECGFAFKNVWYDAPTGNPCEYTHHNVNYANWDAATETYTTVFEPYGGGTVINHTYEYSHIEGDGTALPKMHKNLCTVCGAEERVSCSFGRVRGYGEDVDGVYHEYNEYRCHFCGFRYVEDRYDLYGDCCAERHVTYTYTDANGNEVVLDTCRLEPNSYKTECVANADGSITRFVSCGECGKTSGETVTVTPDSPYELTPVTEGAAPYIVYAVTVDGTGDYSFSSQNADGMQGYYDAFGRVFDENGDFLAEADGGYDNGHFYMNVYLEEGRTYYLVFCHYSETLGEISSETGDFVIYFGKN